MTRYINMENIVHEINAHEELAANINDDGTISSAVFDTYADKETWLTQK